MSEDQADYVTDALEMIGKGYDQPTVIIEAPRTYTARHNGRMVEVEEPAWVKFSTDFKKELQTLDEYSLKVLLYIGLSVNFRTGTAYPGTRNIAEETGMSPNTVTKAIKNLEEQDFLQVFRKTGSPTIFKPLRFISIGTVAPHATPLSQKADELSQIPAELSHAQEGNLHNKNNKNQLENVSLGKAPIKLDFIDGMIKYHISPKAIQDAFRDYFKLTPNWSAKYNSQFMEWAVETKITPEQVKRAADLWRMDKRFNWKVADLKGIQEHWLELVEIEQSTRPEHKPFIEPEAHYVPNPNKTKPAILLRQDRLNRTESD